MKKIKFISGLSLCCLLISCSQRTSFDLKSPNGNIEVTLKDSNETITYCASIDGKPVISDSKLGFELDKGNLDQFVVLNSQRTSFDQTWEQPWGESQLVRNNYNELKVFLQEKAGLKRKLNIIFRVFDDGFGFRYEFPEQVNLTDFQIMKEETQFKLPQVDSAWWTPSREPYFESIVRHTAINKMDTVTTPLTIETPNGHFLAIHEANLTDYAKMNLYTSDSTTLNAYLSPWANGVKVYAKTPFVSPWRTIILAKTLEDLVTSNIMLNLNESSKIADVSWCKPGKYIGIWWDMHMGNYTWHAGLKHGATTANTKKYIDFAAANGFSGVLVEGWNASWEGNWMKNANTISFTKSYPDFDLKAVTDYAASKGVKIIGHNETGAATKNYENQLDSAFSLYQKNGVSVVKTGYVGVLLDGKELHDGQYGVRHYRKVIETAAKYKICIDNHEPVMPTGLQRTYPNLMTQEGVRGQEYNAWSPDGGNPPEHTVVVPFVRGLAGPMDFTFGTFDFTNKAYPKTRVQSTIAKQLALYVVIYSPLQMASDIPEHYKGVKAFDFIKDVPCDWKKTRVLDGKIGDYAIFARQDRASDNWYIGCITDENARTLTIDFSFLDKGVKYTAQIYKDGDNADWKTNPTSVSYEEKEVTADQKMTVKLATSGGCAIRLVKNKR